MTAICIRADLEVQVYDPMSMDVAHAFQNLFDDNTASFLAENKLILYNSVKQFASSYAKHIKKFTYYKTRVLLTTLL